MNEMPTSIATSTVKIGHVELIVHQLSDGRRIIEEDSFLAFFKALEDGSLFLTPEDADSIARAVQS